MLALRDRFEKHTYTKSRSISNASAFLYRLRIHTDAINGKATGS